MPALPFPVRPGPRRVIAMTCTVCGELRSGDEFDRRCRLPGQPAYLDRRCRKCRWARMESMLGLIRTRY